MATVTLTSRLNDLIDSLDTWSGFLLQADGSTTVQSRSATQFSLTHGSGSPFEGCRVIVTGTGFAYDDGDPTEGTIQSLSIRDASGEMLLTITGLAGGGIAGDLAQFHANLFGSDTFQSPDGKAAWSHLLSGNDTITGTSGDDDQVMVTGLNTGNDTFNMGAGDDLIESGVGSDTINGGTGFDELSFEAVTWSDSYTALRGVVVDMAARTAQDPWGGLDRFTSIEMVTGSRFDDRFTGHASKGDDFAGLRGRDRFDGGANSFDGSGAATDDREDEVHYGDDHFNGGARGIVADLQTALSGGSIRGTVRDGFGQTDRLIDIEGVSGTDAADSLTGSQVGNRLEGGDGRDTLTGGAGADEFLWRHRNDIGDADRITDFKAGGSAADRLAFEVEGFVGMTGTLRLVNGTAATSSQGTFLYDADTDTLTWDSNGTGSGGRAAVAVLEDVASLSTANFELLA